MTIEEFIESRLREDEIQARGGWKEGALNGDQWQVWKVKDGGLLDGGIYVCDPDSPPQGADIVLTRDGETAHIERHDPARVLRGVAANRALLEQYLSAKHRFPNPPAADEPYSRSSIEAMASFDVLRVLVRHTAAIWADHPDYQQEWAV